ncbi:uncharacterized protein LOC132314822 isoform X2 [Cornus florida]|uniref:uncharacterized protein LOC132314822 isoform X2 n=1 Tax=Cornus florida TaxID=4283 RepID=UPI0028A01E4C|nr:uncharacterized protein LOC132314822 isoform X2 [Cornus florida]
MDHETHDQERISESVDSVDSVNSGAGENSKILVDGVVSETVVVIKSDEEEASCVGRENGDLIVKANVPGSSKVSVEEPKIKVLPEEKHSCVIDVKCGGGALGENLDGERVCRICHLSSDQSSETTTATVTVILIHLGCGCKDELGIAHSHCAEAWFTLKGNRMCEICGETAKNVTGVGDNRFMEEWNERSAGSGTNASERGGGCWRGQPFCNFLMACLEVQL